MRTANASTSAQKIPRRESLYLDLVRAISAFVVVLDHAPEHYDLPWMPRLGHHAVMVFFVLSGYVISNVADTRERNGVTFMVARLARLWSVLVPAVALTILCDLIGRRFGLYPAAYQGVPIDHPLIRIAAILSFLSETWVSIQPLSNGVVWSLCVEFWYYVLFAAWTFIPPGRTRRIALTVAAILAGFKALLLLPIWLFGVVLQRSDLLRRLPSVAGAILGVCALVAAGWIALGRIYDGPIGWMHQAVGTWLFTNLAQARVFWFDWLLGLLVALHLLGVRSVIEAIPLERIGGPIRWCANISFAAYLFHMPLLTLTAAFLPRSMGLLGIALTLAAIAVLGPWAERSKHAWRRGLAAIADPLSRQWRSSIAQ